STEGPNGEERQEGSVTHMDGKRRKNQDQLAFGEEGEGEARSPSPGGTEASVAERLPERPAKTTGLMEVIVSPENMKKALKRVMADKGAPGPDGMTVTEITPFLNHNWGRIKGNSSREPTGPNR
ncbi:MAG: hypothetical protein SWK76_04040, partial [Actinomycetota bacterium]|nr:hypothetical protein [Actinomycetota bacterium]